MSTFLFSSFPLFYFTSMHDKLRLNCVVLLIVSSIALVAYQVIEIDDVAGGLLYYVAQSFLLAGSIFGLDQYIRIINKHYHEHTNK